jgi:hypothetical protein
MFGMSELHRRNASPVHICCASALKAKLSRDDSADTETAKASIKAAWRSLRVKEVAMFGSYRHRGLRGPFRDGLSMRRDNRGDCDDHHKTMHPGDIRHSGIAPVTFG